MKLYVDELPKSCIKCPCMNEDGEYGCWCNIETSLDIHTDYDKETFTYKYHRQRHENCPLQSLSDYTKQVRKEVLKEIDYGAIRKMAERPDDLCYKDALCEYFLDQIQEDR